MELTQGGTTPVPFYLALASDHISPATGKSPIVLLWKAGGFFGAPAGVVTETGGGWYKLTPTPADTANAGPLILHVGALGGADPVDDLHFVGTDSLLQGSTRIIPWYHALASDHVSPAGGLTPAVTISKAGSAFTVPAGVVAEIAFGWYGLTPTAADTGTLGPLALQSTAATADPADELYVVEASVVVPWNSAYLLGLFNRLTSRPSVDEITDATKYQWLSEAQHRVVAEIAARAPTVLLGAPQALITSDNKVWTFGTDANGYPIFPMGNARIFPSLGCVPDYPLIEGVDYLQEGTQIRIPNDRTLSGPLYWRGIPQPADISATGQPSLFPEPSRNLIALEAARAFMQTLDRPDRHDDLGTDYARELARWLLVWKRQFSNGGALGSLTGFRLSLLGRVA